ncbi:HWE histidine kinase domain-containing protein [Phenylobacterium sp.]|uniref:sensor histidine kinase n=1 Tax=Phenylobacterium sp. TaxID=1871053 RepID=UPI00301C2E95
MRGYTVGGRDSEPSRDGMVASEAALTALTQAPLGIAIFDRDMRYLAASSQYLTDQGLPPDTRFLGRVHYDLFPDIPRKWRDIHARVIREGVEFRHEADLHEPAGGGAQWIRWLAAPWRDPSGAVGGLILYTEVATVRVEAQRRIEAAEARYRAVFDQAAMGVALVAPDGTFLEVNDRFCEICRRPRANLMGLRFHDITHPDDLDADLDLADALLAGETRSFSMEKRYVDAAGEPVWVELTASLVRTPDDTPDYFVSVIADIGARKQAQAAQQRYQDQLRLMINELNHRVKNTLATVQSMAAQTLRAESDPSAAYGKFEARLMGLSEVHAVLTREKWHGADLREVAQRALTPFGQASGEVSADGPDVWLTPGAALTMALVFHELATNAVKYGALSRAGGRVEITWRADGEPARLKLRWRERGGPPVASPTRRGFGSRLIERALAGDLQGRAVMTFAPEGLDCDLEAVVSGPPDMPGIEERTLDDM